MACKYCQKSLFKEKLGRCHFCMWLNLFLLLVTGFGCYVFYKMGLKRVEVVALAFAFVASAFLMLMHVSAYFFYRFKGIKKPTEAFINQDKKH